LLTVSIEIMRAILRMLLPTFWVILRAKYFPLLVAPDNPNCYQQLPQPLSRVYLWSKREMLFLQPDKEARDAFSQ
jgi:hypothetical protein